MEGTEVSSIIEDLDYTLDDLENALKPLLDHSIVDTANQLPALDRSKLHVLTTYAIESLLFSYLRINGVSAKEHPVFRELARVKQYFEKIKAAETGESKPNLRVDRPAVDRMLKHALAEDSYKNKRRANSEQISRTSTGERPSKKPKANKDKK